MKPGWKVDYLIFTAGCTAECIGHDRWSTNGALDDEDFGVTVKLQHRKRDSPSNRLLLERLRRGG